MQTGITKLNTPLQFSITAFATCMLLAVQAAAEGVVLKIRFTVLN